MMAEAGDPWAIKTLAEAQARRRQASAKDAALSEAMRAATDIVTWRFGPNAPGWRVHRLAQALTGRRG